MISYFLSAPGSSGSVVLYDFWSIWIVHICTPLETVFQWTWIQHFNQGFPNSDSKAPNFTFCKNIVKSSLWFLYIIFQNNNLDCLRDLQMKLAKQEKKTLSEYFCWLFCKLACILSTWIWKRFHISQKRGSWSRNVDKFRSVRIRIQELGQIEIHPDPDQSEKPLYHEWDLLPVLQIHKCIDVSFSFLKSFLLIKHPIHGQLSRDYLLAFSVWWVDSEWSFHERRRKLQK